MLLSVIMPLITVAQTAQTAQLSANIEQSAEPLSLEEGETY